MPPFHSGRWAIGTRTVHHPDTEVPTKPVAPPLYQSATFRAASAEAVARYSHEIQPQAFYTRWGNPTVEVWEKVMADLEGGRKCLAFASGMAAVSTTLLSLLQPGDHVVAGASLYTATTRLLAHELPSLGITADFVDTTDADRLAAAVGSSTRMLYVESPTNPTLMLADLPVLGDIARRHGVLLVVDNTFATPCNQRPLELGAHVVIHSATKYLSGHSDVVAGCVITNDQTAERLWHKRTMLGGSLDPFAAWLLLRGMKTLALRIQRHNRSAMAVAGAIEKHRAVARVFYPGLPSHPQHALACRQMEGPGGMVAFELVGGRQAGVRLVESTELALLAVSLGGVETLIEHPASMSHSMLSDEELGRAGIPPGLIRLSVGIEDPDDLVADLLQALDRIA